MNEKKIKTIAQYKEDFVPEGLSSDKVLENRYLYSKTTYDENGNVIEDERFDAQGNPEEKEVKSYDDEGRLTESKSILHGEVAEHKSYEYQNGKLKREYVHYVDGAKDTIAYEYEDGELKEKLFYDEDQELEKSISFEREPGKLSEITKDEDGGVIEEKQQVYEDDLLVEESYTDHFSGTSYRVKYSYDDSGKEKASQRFDSEGGLLESVEKTYDEDGNLIRMEDVENQRVVVMEYDDQGNNILQEERMEDGTVVSTISRVFDADGLHISSEVFLNGMGQQMSQRYNVYREYEFFNL